MAQDCRAFLVHRVFSPLRVTLGLFSHIGMLTGHPFSKMPRLSIDRFICGFIAQTVSRRKKRLSNRWRDCIISRCVNGIGIVGLRWDITSPLTSGIQW
jgi:hypothetical protein